MLTGLSPKMQKENNNRKIQRERGYLVSCTTECIQPKCVFQLLRIREVQGAALIGVHVIGARGAGVVGWLTALLKGRAADFMVRAFSPVPWS